MSHFLEGAPGWGVKFLSLSYRKGAAEFPHCGLSDVLCASKKCDPHQNHLENQILWGGNQFFFLTLRVPCRTMTPIWAYIWEHLYCFFMVIYTLNSLKMGSKPNYQDRGMWGTSYPWPQDSPCVLQEFRKTLERNLEDKESLDTPLMHQSWWNFHQTSQGPLWFFWHHK